MTLAAPSVIASVSDAKDTWLLAQKEADDRTLRIVRKATELLRGEYALSMGGFNVVGLAIGDRFTEASPWNGDVVSIQCWTDAAASITLALTVARWPSLTATSMGPAITLAPTFFVEDISTVDETDLTGGANGPNLVTLDLTNAGFVTNLNAHDVVFCTLSSVSSAKLLGVQLKCTMRVQQEALPTP